MPRRGRGGPIPPDGRPVAPAGPGAASTRTDLARPAGTQPVAAPGGLPYGARGALENAQRAIPLPDARTAPASGPPSTLSATPMSLTGPSELPDEPLTTGIPLGPGPGPEALTGVNEIEAAARKVDLLRRMAARPWASPQLRRLIVQAEQELFDLIDPPVASPMSPELVPGEGMVL